MATIVVPDFPFSGHYYPEILEDLIQANRQNAPELSDESPEEPHIQLLRDFAVSAHLNNVLLDVVANEMYLPTCTLRGSAAALLALINYKLAQATPADVDVVYTINRQFTASTTVVPKGTSFATEDTGAAQGIGFEIQTDVKTTRTDQVGYVFAFDSASDTYTDHSVAAQSNTPFTVGWGTANGPTDILFIGHPNILWDEISINLAVAAGAVDNGVWEYFDGNTYQTAPTAVVNLGATIQFDVTSILGAANRAVSGVRVTCVLTGVSQNCVSTWTGSINIITTSAPVAFLGQTVPSTNPADYIIGADWRELPGISDGTISSGRPFQAIGDDAITFTLPQTATQNWHLTGVGPTNGETVAYWIRFRIISVGGAGSPTTKPVINSLLITKGNQYQIITATQGKTRADNPLGSSSGLPNQEFQLVNSPVIDDDSLAIFVTEASIESQWDRVDNFLNSNSTDPHYTVDFDDDGVATITFGDGTNGKIPAADSNNIRAQYRTLDLNSDGSIQNGNVGALTVNQNRSGVAYISAVFNPRPASGFAVAEGSTPASLAQAKLAGPAQLRTLGRGVSLSDIQTLAVNFIDADGSKPFARCLGIEESFGPKTVEAVCVGQGGAVPLSTQLSDLDDYFNGTTADQGILLVNTEVVATPYVQHPIDINAIMHGGALSSITAALTGLLNPLSIEEDGSFTWQFAGVVVVARLIQEIMNTSPRPSDCTIVTPSANVTLAQRELPVPGTFTISIA